MHQDWKAMDSAAKAVFLNDQRVFSAETFVADLIDLEWIALSFFSGHRLVRAIIHPQTIEIAGREPIELTSDHRSYFLYNPDTAVLKAKVIPLNNKSDTVHFANELLGLKLTKDTVVDYVQYFGMVVEGDEGPFCFVAHVDEIPYSDNATELEKAEIVGRLASVANYRDDKSFDIAVKEHRDIFGRSFSLSLPCIYAQGGFKSTMSVSSNGHIRMDEDEPIALGFAVQKSDLPHYSVEPTGALRRERNRRTFWSGMAVLFLVIPLSLAAIVLGLAGSFGILALLIDVLIGAHLGGVSAWINNLVTSQSWLVWGIYLGSITSLVLSLFAVAFLRLAEHIAKRRPGVIAQWVETLSRRERRPRRSIGNRGLFLLRTFLLGFVGTVLAWSTFVFTQQLLFSNVFSGLDADFSMKAAFGAVVDEMTGWLGRGEDPLHIRSSIRQIFGYAGELSPTGKVIRTIAAFYIPLTLGETMRRGFRNSRPDAD